MAEPTKKAPEINQFISNMMGREREATIREDRCMVCGGPAANFRDALSEKEYTISGMCQNCQDEMFGV